MKAVEEDGAVMQAPADCSVCSEEKILLSARFEGKGTVGAFLAVAVLTLMGRLLMK